MYAGAHGPLSSLRLEAYRRGLEDRALLALLSAPQRATRMLNTRGVSSFNDQNTNNSNTRILVRKACIVLYVIRGPSLCLAS